MPSTTWKTNANGLFLAASNWSTGVPDLGIDAIIDGTTSTPLVVSIASGNGSARTLTTQYAGISMTGGSLTFAQTSSITTTGAAFTQSAGFLDFQNGESLNQTSTIAGNGSAVLQTGGTIQIDQGYLDLFGNSIFAGTITGANGGGTVVFGTNGAPGETYTINTGATITTGGWQVVDNGTEVILKENLSYAGVLYQAINTSVLLGGHTLTLNGTTTSTAAYTGPGKLLVGGTFINSDAGNNPAGISIGGGATLEVSGTFDNTPASNGFGTELYLGDATSPVATLLIDPTGTFDFTGDGGYNGIGNTGKSVVLLNGLLEKSRGIGVNYVDPTITMSATGVVAVASGDIYFRGTNNVFAGTFKNLPAGAGGVIFGGGGTDTLLAGTTITTSDLTVQDSGTTLVLAENLTYAGTLFQGVGTTLALDGHTLTLSGAVTSTAAYTGGGKVLVTGTFTNSDAGYNPDGISIGGGGTLEVSGTFNNSPATNGFGTELYLGDGGTPTATLLIDSTGTFDFTGDGGYTGIGNNGNSVVLLNGLLEKTRGIGTDYVDPTVTMSVTGVVAIASGDIYFRANGDVFAGSIKNLASGAGGVIFGGGGTDTLSAGATITTSYLTIQDNGTSLLLAENLSYAGTLSQAIYTSVQLAGHTLTLTGAVTSTAGYFGGGKVLTTGTFNNSDAGYNPSGIEVGSGVTLEVAGTFNNTPASNGFGTELYLGDGGTPTATLQIDSTGTFDFNGDGGYTGIGHNGNSVVLLNGLLEKTSGTGTVYVDPTATMSATGTVAVATGDVYFRGTNSSFAGTFENLANGSGGVIFGGGGTDTFASGATITTSSLTVQDSGTSFVLGEALAYAGNFAEGAGATIQLDGHGLRLEGTSSIAGLVTGNGLLINYGGTMAIDGATIGGAAVLYIQGATALSGDATIGDSSTSTAMLEIVANSTLSLTADAQIAANGSGALKNAGSLLKVAGSGTAVIDTTVSNTGSIGVTTGALLLHATATNDGTASASLGATIDFAGALTADTGKAGTITLSKGASAVFGGYVDASQTLRFVDNTDTATISAFSLFHGTVAGFVAGDTIDVAGFGLPTTKSVSGDTLKLENASQDFNLIFAGSPVLADFTFASDGDGGTLIGYTSGTAAGHLQAAPDLHTAFISTHPLA
jgi:hypothetical protein